MHSCEIVLPDAYQPIRCHGMKVELMVRHGTVREGKHQPDRCSSGGEPEGSIYYVSHPPDATNDVI